MTPGNRSKPSEGRRRVVVEGIVPEIDGGRFPIKRVVGEAVSVQADVFADGHDEVVALLRYRPERQGEWHEVVMTPLGNDRWEARFAVTELGRHEYTVGGWVDPFATWQKDLEKKREAGQDVAVELRMGARLLEEGAARASGAEAERLRELARRLAAAEDPEGAADLGLGAEVTRLMQAFPDRTLATEYGRTLPLVVEPPLALFSAWYEIFPRSWGPSGRHGTLEDCGRLLPEIARMGFDVIYLPPIHPIGTTNRKGIDNVPRAEPGEPGSPWAIGNAEGGHKAVHPELGTLEDFDRFVRRATELGLRVALDLAFQCSPDHPYVREHPQWFRWRPDGSLQHAENPPKRYEDVVPLEFGSEDWEALWEELRSVVLFWIEHGVTVFRVDNPHTKPFAFWEWLIEEVKREHPEALFLAEAFTRPRVMQRLAKLGFSQSYTYFTWRNTAYELATYVTELTRTALREYFRPNFWPNTPDILPEYLQYGGRPAFIVRLVLTATLSSNYGIYGPAFELCAAEALPGREEYQRSEKYELKRWDRSWPGSLAELISRVNRIRRDNSALQTTWNTRFYESEDENVLFYGKSSEDGSNTLLIAVNLDPFHRRSCRVRVPLEELGIPRGQSYLVHDLLGDDRFIWQSDWNLLDLDPQVLPARIFRLRSRLKRERDFDYFM